jgi:ankyrin repeat protein
VQHELLVGAVGEAFQHARYNRAGDIEQLLQEGLPVDVRDAHGNTLLAVACQNGHKR